MDPATRRTTIAMGAERAPFSYGRQRPVLESPQRPADATSHGRSPPHTRSTKSRRRGVRVAGRPLDIGAAVRARASRASGTEHVFGLDSLSLSNRSISLSFTGPQVPTLPPPPPLLVDPVASCLRRLRYARSARAWDAVAGGCVAEAKQLGEADNDILAWAASFVLERDPRQGLLLLESYVIATCAVVHEQRQGLLTNSSACVKRYNELILDWLRHRSQDGTLTAARLMHCDIDPLRVSESTVRQTVLQSMQLMDAVELRRWYVMALVLCTSDVSATGSSSPGQARHKSSSSPAPQSSNADAAGGAPELGRTQGSSEPASSGSPPQNDDGSAAAGEGTSSASDGYQAPLNVWFRFFFALCETPPGGTLRPPTASQSGGEKSDDELSVHMGSRRVSTSGAAGNGHPGRQAWTRPWFKDRRGNPTLGTRSRNASIYSSAALVSRVEPRWSIAALRPLDQEETAALLLAHCEEWDVFFITAVTALLTERYRTCMMAASRFLHWAEANRAPQSPPKAGGRPTVGATAAPADAGGDTPSSEAAAAAAEGGRASPSSFTGIPGLQEYQRRLAILFRAWASLRLGERLQFGKDVIALLSYPDDTLTYHVGCAIALYGLPLPAAKETVMRDVAAVTSGSADRLGPSSGRPSPHAPFTLAVQRYLHVMTESVHALTLLQLGMVEAALTVATATLNRTEALRRQHKHHCHAGEADDAVLLGALRSVAVTAATALEDAAAVLQVPLSAHHLVYIAVSPVFFGGLCAGGIRVEAQSDTHRLLYPSNLPLYASTRQVLPFHMNRAVYLLHSRQLRGAWDDACCAVAAADEVVGSVEFAFTDCFPLRVYHFACYVGFALLDLLLFDDLEAAKACLANPTDQAALDKKDMTLQENETLSKEVVHICEDVVCRMRHFYPHSRLTELCAVQLAIMRGEKAFLSQAVLLADRYPHCPAAQNLLTLALYFEHHVPEAVDSAVKNLQDFPHSPEIVRVHHILQPRGIVYHFNYRGVLPLSYSPGKASGTLSLRMVLMMVLLFANCALVALTVYANTPTITRYPNSMQNLVVRIQVPSLVPLFFAAIVVIHAIVSAVTSKNLISTTLTDLFFINTPINRALFCLRSIPLVNVVNALLISVAGNNFLFESGSATFVLYFLLTVLFVPFTTRVWFLRSVDEPDVDIMDWLAILAVDIVTAFFVVIPHIILALLEPYMLVLFYFYAPTPRPRPDVGELPPSKSIRRRLLLHARFSKFMPSRFAVGSGSRFVHIRCLRWLYYRTHCPMDTRYLAESQLEAEMYRVFPLIEGDEARKLFAHVPLTPMCAALSSVEEETPLSTDAPANSADKNARQAESKHVPSSGNGANGQPPAPAPASRAPVTSTNARGRHQSPSQQRQQLASDEDEEERSMGDDVRTVGALRRQLCRSTRQQHPSFHKAASFMRSTRRTSISDEDDDDDDDDGTGWDASDSDNRYAAAPLRRSADGGERRHESPKSSTLSPSGSSSSSSSSLHSSSDAHSDGWSYSFLMPAGSRPESPA